MTIVTGLATASGLSALLNAPREATQDRNTITAKSDKAVSVELSRTAQRINAMAGQSRVASQPETQVARDASKTGTPDDSRLSKFVEAVQALRLDQDAAAALPPDRVRQYKEAAEEVFNMGDDVPRDLRPSERAYEAFRTREAAEKIERKADAQRAALEPAADPADSTDTADPVFAKADVKAPAGDTAPTLPDLPEVATTPTPPAEDPAIPEPAIATSADTSASSTQAAAPAAPVQPAPEPV